MGNQLSATAVLVNNKVKFEASTREVEKVTIDYDQPIGDGEGYTSLELFLISLATCAGTAVTILLRKQHKQVDGLRIEATGQRREEHPTYFREIHLHFIVESNDVEPANMNQAIHLSETSICPVWNMIKGTVEVTNDFEITRK